MTQKIPDWDALYELAEAQAGYFTSQQAAEAGYSPQLLHHHRHGGKIERVGRGVYRIVHFPPTDQEELVPLWLWSRREGVFSHATALASRDLSDVLPSVLHLTLPSAWKARRLRTPKGVMLHYADLKPEDRSWVGPVPMTSPKRTLLDVIRSRLAPDLVQQAIEQADARGLISKRDRDKLEALAELSLEESA